MKLINKQGLLKLSLPGKSSAPTVKKESQLKAEFFSSQVRYPGGSVRRVPLRCFQTNNELSKNESDRRNASFG
jgi:hypothetical protein